MHTKLAILLLTLVGISFSLNCADNPMAKPFNRFGPVGGWITTPANAPDTLPFCKAFQSKSVCCSVDGFNEIKTKFDAAKAKFDEVRKERLKRF